MKSNRLYIGRLTELGKLLLVIQIQHYIIRFTVLRRVEKEISIEQVLLIERECFLGFIKNKGKKLQPVKNRFGFIT